MLCMFTACALGSHFRGGIVMVRPISGGEKNEVRIIDVTETRCCVRIVSMVVLYDYFCILILSMSNG